MRFRWEKILVRLILFCSVRIEQESIKPRQILLNQEKTDGFRGYFVLKVRVSLCKKIEMHGRL